MKHINIIYLISITILQPFNICNSSQNIDEDVQTIGYVYQSKDFHEKKRKDSNDHKFIDMDAEHEFSSKKAKTSPLKTNNYKKLTFLDQANREKIEQDLAQLDIKNAWYPKLHNFTSIELNEYFKDFLENAKFKPSTIILGNYLFKQYLMTRDEHQLQMAASTYHAPALVELSTILTDRECAAHSINLAGAQGYAPALYSLSQAFDHSPELYNLSKTNSKFAYLLCKEAAKLGDLQAQWSLASALLTGYLDQAVQPLKGFQKLDKLCSNGNSYAINAAKLIIDTADETFYEAYEFVKPAYEWKFLK